MRSKLIILSILAMAILSCKKESPLFVYTTVDGLDWQTTCAQGNYNYRLRTISTSTTGAVRHIKISSFDSEYGIRDVLDTIFADPMKEVEMMSMYRTLEYEDTARVELTINAYATDGETASTYIILTVLPTAEPLQPGDNLTLYSDLSGRPSCFSLRTKTAFMKADTMDVKDFYFSDVAPADSSDMLSRMWRSNDIFFARAESFNYAEATSFMVRNAYAACQRAHTIQEIKDDDVLLFGTATDALGVLKVNYVMDEAERVNDRYNFSMKLIPNSIPN